MPCTCKTGCDTNRCSCRKNNQNCSGDCQCIGCQNNKSNEFKKYKGFFTKSDKAYYKVVCPHCYYQENYIEIEPPVKFYNTIECQRCQKKINFQVMQVRSKKSKKDIYSPQVNNYREAFKAIGNFVNTREFTIRAIDDSGLEHLVTFTRFPDNAYSNSVDDIEMRSRDIIMLTYLGSDVKCVTNFTTNECLVLSIIKQRNGMIDSSSSCSTLILVTSLVFYLLSKMISSINTFI